jgi:endoglucanase
MRRGSRPQSIVPLSLLALASAVGCRTSSSSDAGAAASAPCAPPPAVTSSPYELRYDQLGYLPSGAKWGVVLSDGKPPPKYRVLDAATFCPVGSGTAGPRVLDTKSRAKSPLTGDQVDLSSMSRAGSYLVVLEDGARFGPITVSPDVYKGVLPAVLQFFAAQRCGPTTVEVSHHEACHLFAHVANAKSGDGVVVDDGFTGKVDAHAGPVVNTEGGWHDAGDYIKFLGTTAFVLAVNLLAVRDHPRIFASPQAGAALEGIKTEMRWGLDWLVRMLGGNEILHQVSGERDHDPGWRDPAADKATPMKDYDQRPSFRFAPRRGGNLLGRSAAALALAAQVYTDDPPYAAKMLALARKVYAEGRYRLLAQAPDPSDFYPEKSVHDDLAFGAAVLAEVTGESNYKSEALNHVRTIRQSAHLIWQDVSALALLETALLYPPGSPERAEVARQLNQSVKDIATSFRKPFGAAAPFRYALAEVGNGSVEEAIGAGAACLAAHRLGGNEDCPEVARTQLHWLFGQNPFGVSFMIGMGKTFPRDVHHSLAEALHFTLTGAVVGGPTTIRQVFGADQVPATSGPYLKWSTDDLYYEDVQANYVCNEPAIDFVAPLFFVLGELLETP